MGVLTGWFRSLDKPRSGVCLLLCGSGFICFFPGYHLQKLGGSRSIGNPISLCNRCSGFFVYLQLRFRNYGVYSGNILPARYTISPGANQAMVDLAMDECISYCGGVFLIWKITSRIFSTWPFRDLAEPWKLFKIWLTDLASVSSPQIWPTVFLGF